jgi:hypothetical protein
MISGEGEKVPLSVCAADRVPAVPHTPACRQEKLIAKESAEVWMAALERSMKTTISETLKAAMDAYPTVLTPARHAAPSQRADVRACSCSVADRSRGRGAAPLAAAARAASAGRADG